MPIIQAGVAVASTVAGVIGGNNANAEAKKAEHHRKNMAKKEKARQNEYNKKLDAADRANYTAMRDYNQQVAVTNWERKKEIQDYQHARDLAQYNASENIANANLALNNISTGQALESNQAAIDDMFLQQQFDRRAQLSELQSALTEGNLNIRVQNLESLKIQNNKSTGTASLNNSIDQLMKESAFAKQNTIVEGLIKEGRAALGQAGQSAAKRQQSASAELQRGLMQLNSELTGKRKAAGIQLAKLSAESSLAQTGVGLNIEAIQNKIADAQAEAEFNNEVLASNMTSFLKQAERNVQGIYLQKLVADQNTEARRMIKPEKLSYEPEPTQPPERVFVKRMRVGSAYVAPAEQQSIVPTIFKGVASVAGAVNKMNLNFGGDPGGGGMFDPGGSLNTFNPNAGNFTGNTFGSFNGGGSGAFSLQASPSFQPFSQF